MALFWSWSDIRHTLLIELMIIITTMKGIVVIANMFLSISHMLVDIFTKSFNIINDKRFHLVVIIIEDRSLGIFVRIFDSVNQLSIFRSKADLNIVLAFFYDGQKHVRKGILFKPFTWFDLQPYFFN